MTEGDARTWLHQHQEVYLDMLQHASGAVRYRGRVRYGSGIYVEARTMVELVQRLFTNAREYAEIERATSTLEARKQAWSDADAKADKAAGVGP